MKILWESDKGERRESDKGEDTWHFAIKPSLYIKIRTRVYYMRSVLLSAARSMRRDTPSPCECLEPYTTAYTHHKGNYQYIKSDTYDLLCKLNYVNVGV